MSEITKFDYIGIKAFKNISGITRYSTDSVYISAINSTKSLATYKIDNTGTLHNGPVYNTAIINQDIQHISTFNDLLLIVPTSEFKVYLLNPNQTGKIELRVLNETSHTLEPIIDFVLTPIIRLPSFEHMHQCDFKIMGAVVANGKLYFFIETLSNIRERYLCIVEALINSGTSISLKSQMVLKAMFSLHKLGQSMNFSHCALKTITTGGITFNNTTSSFVLLMKYISRDKKGFCVKLALYPQINGIGASLQPFRTSDAFCRLFKISLNPVSIAYLSENNYIIITNYDHHNRPHPRHEESKEETDSHHSHHHDEHLTKYYIVKLL